MSPILLARAMRSRGWTYWRRSKGMAIFNLRFSNGRGWSRAVSLFQVASLQMTPDQLADYFTKEARLQRGMAI